MEPMMVTENLTESVKTRPLSSFIRKLWFLLTSQDYKDYIYWVDHGQTICIPNSSSFTEIILPKLFKHNNWQSFIRQLNLYGFRKVYLYNREVLNDTNLYFKHEHFKKDCPEELFEIKRQVHNKPENDTRHLGAMEAPTTNEEAIQRVKLKLEEADEKSNELTRYVNHLHTVQMQQQEAIDEILDKMIRSVANTEHSTNKNFAEKVNRISHVNEMNKALFYRKSANQLTGETSENENSRRMLEDENMVMEEDGRLYYYSGSEQDMLEEEYGYENDEYIYMPDSPSEAGPSSPLLSNRDKRGSLSIDTLLIHDTSLSSKRKKKE